jgi:hypothetical protein
MNTLRTSVVLLVALLVLGHLGTAAARGDDNDPDVLIMRGLDLRRAGRSEAALDLFRRAYQAAPSARTLGQMGLVESSLQLWLDADAHLGAALATPDDVWVHRNRQFLELAMERTKEHVGELVIVGPPGTRVSLGGKPVGSLPVAPIRVAEGELNVSAAADGHKPYSVEVSIKGGARAAISIVLEPLDLGAPNREVQPLVSADRPPMRTRARAGVALAAAGVAVLAWGIVWVALDGRQSCDGCKTSYDTKTSGFILVGGGTALALAGGALLFSAVHSVTPSTTIGLSARSFRLEARF